MLLKHIYIYELLIPGMKKYLQYIKDCFDPYGSRNDSYSFIALLMNQKNIVCLINKNSKDN
ncbi:hypothetical protein DRQ09_05805 [candidate division KSB1 bacterium]|nr:MAG: hypothetical protein DRQ09_05805 [candidate division KSB1 bacterium]